MKVLCKSNCYYVDTRGYCAIAKKALSFFEVIDKEGKCSVRCSFYFNKKDKYVPKEE